MNIEDFRDFLLTKSSDVSVINHLKSFSLAKNLRHLYTIKDLKYGDYFIEISFTNYCDAVLVKVSKNSFEFDPMRGWFAKFYSSDFGVSSISDDSLDKMIFAMENGDDSHSIFENFEYANDIVYDCVRHCHKQAVEVESYPEISPFNFGIMRVFEEYSKFADIGKYIQENINQVKFAFELEEQMLNANQKAMRNVNLREYAEWFDVPEEIWDEYVNESPISRLYKILKPLID